MSNRDKWIGECKKLPVNTRQRVQCCGDDRSRIIEHLPDRYVSNCFRSTCENYVEKKTGLSRFAAQQQAKEVRQELKKNAIPFDTTYESTQFSSEAVAWLSKAGIHQNVWEKYGFGYSPKYNRVVIPIHQDGHKVGATLRALNDGDIKYLMHTDQKGRIYTCIDNDGRGDVVLTEDILSAIRVKEAAPWYDVCCILGTGVMMERLLYIVSKYTNVHIWLDGDEAGIKATAKWLDKLKPYRNTTWTTCKFADPKDFTDDAIRTILREDFV